MVAHTCVQLLAQDNWKNKNSVAYCRLVSSVLGG